MTAPRSLGSANDRSLAIQGPQAKETLDAPALASLIRDVMTSSFDVIQARMELAVLEMRLDASLALRDAVSRVIGGALGSLGLAFVLAGAVRGLETILPTWAVYLIIGTSICASAALVIGAANRKQRRQSATEEQLERSRDSGAP